MLIGGGSVLSAIQTRIVYELKFCQTRLDPFGDLAPMCFYGKYYFYI